MASLGEKFRCFQEADGQFGKFVTKQVAENMPPNIIYECSRSGKMSTSLVVSWMKRVLKEELQDTSLLLLDSWSGQTDSTLSSKAFPGSDIDLCIKVIPAKTIFCKLHLKNLTSIFIVSGSNGLYFWHNVCRFVGNNIANVLLNFENASNIFYFIFPPMKIYFF